MDNKLNSVPSVGTEVENSTNVEVSSVNPNDTKPIVGCSATLSDPLQQVLLCLNNLTINEAREVIRKASVTLTQFTNTKTEDIVFVN